MKYIKPRNVFVFENMDKAKSIFNKKVQDFEKLKALLQKNLGYIGKFTEYLLDDNVPYNELENLYGELVNLQKRQSPIDINKLSYEQALDKIQSTKENIKIKEFLNLLPSEQKEYAKSILEWNKKLVLDVANSPNLDKIVSKISRYKSVGELESALMIISKPKDNSKEGVKGEISGLRNSKIAFDGENLLIVIVNSYDDIKSLGSDTSWCIVTSEHQYERYTRGRFQYVIYDYSKDEFDQKFKIGLTLEKDGDIYACHDILDKKVTESQIIELLSSNGIKIEDILPKFEPVNIDISSINKNTNFSKIEEILGSVTKEQTLEILKKACQIGEIRTPRGYVGDKERSKTSLIKKCYKKIFGSRDWVLFSELTKISKEVAEYFSKGWYGIDNLITKNINFDLKEKSFSKGLEVWKDSEFKEFRSSNLRDIEDFSDEVKIRLFERLKGVIGSKNKDKNFMTSIIILAKSLNKLDEIEGWKDILNVAVNDTSYNSRRLELIRSFGLEFSLDGMPFTSISELGKEDVENVIKKDYSDIWITPYNIDFFVTLIERLGDNKLGFKIRKGDIFLIFDLGSKLKGILFDIINELDGIKRKSIGHTITKGNVSVTIS